jgi:hypothetical protein
MYIYIYNSNYEFKWINNYLSSTYIIKIKSFVLKVLEKWNRNNKILILLILIMLFIGIGSSTYILYLIYNNFDKFIDLYLKYKNIK